ncbi:MAG TPA: acyltransferase [Urbifossiella sp.]|nr:acyltransferase [Urbifossiella sp.]
MDAPHGPKLDALTGLRYLAAISVVVAHVSHFLPPGDLQLALNGLSAPAMTVFFTLSGFLMAYNYSAGLRARFGRTLWSYYVARVARIYPAYAVALLLYFSFPGNIFQDLKAYPEDTRKTLAYAATLTQSWGHTPVFLADSNPRTVAVGYNGVSWSVSTEAFFYLVFPLVALPIARVVTGRGRALAGCAAVYVVYLIAGQVIYRTTPIEVVLSPGVGMSRYWWKIYLCPYIRFGEFLMGAIVGQYVLATARPVPAGRRWWAGAAALASATAVLLVGNARILSPDLFGAAPTPRWLHVAATNVLYAPLCLVVIYQLATLPCAATRVMGCRPMVLLGEMSYCMYLVHTLVMCYYVPRIGGEFTKEPGWQILYHLTAMVAVLHLTALGLYRYVEVPARTAIRSWLDPRPAPRPATIPLAPAPARRAA